jgi:hypothetical protein
MIWTGKSLAAGEKMQGYFAERKRQRTAKLKRLK